MARPRAGWRTGLAAVGLLVAVLLSVTYAWRSRRAEPAAPPAVAPSPSRDVPHDVRHRGDEACARCHVRIAASYRRHPMGRSLAPTAEAAPVERYDKGSHNPFSAGGFRYEVRRDGNQFLHAETRVDAEGREVAGLSVPVDF